VIITECVLHGFKRFADPFTLHFKPGLNLVAGGNESGKSTLCEAILAALFASPSSSAFLNWSHSEVCRILLFFSTPQGRFHIVKDFVQHSADLSAWDPAKSAFVSTAQDPSHIAGLLSKELGGMGESEYRTLCVLQPPPWLPPPLAPTPTLRPSSAPAAPEKLPETKRDRLQQLKGFLGTHSKIRETEALLDSLRAQHDETRASLQELVSFEEERRGVREALESFQPLASLATSSLLPQISEYQKALQKKDEEARGLDQKIEEVQNRLAMIPSTRIFMDRLFLAGGGLLALSLLAAQFLPYVGVGIFAGLGCIAAALVQYLNRSQTRDKIQRALAALEYQREKGLDLRIGRQHQPLLDLLPRAGCQEVSELVAKLRQRDTLKEKLTTLDQKIAGLSAQADLAALEGKKRSLEEAIQVAEEELRSLGFVPEPAEVKREIERIERGTVSAEGPAPPSRERPTQGVDTLLSALDSHLGEPGAPLLSSIDAQASSLIAEITGGRYTHIRWTPDDGLRLVLAGSQGERSLAEMSHGTQDVAMLAWHLALLAAIARTSAAPLLLDNPFLCLDGERRKHLLPCLQSLARTRQVILFSHDAWIPSQAAHIVALDR
jgi:energy-coupling factor transporter ATP-binding protein EcfA2